MAYVTYDDFANLEIRIAKVISAEPIKGKTRILKGRIDIGDGDERDVIIGGAQYYTPEEMIGRMVVVVANLEPRTVAGVKSSAMLLAADVSDKPFWLMPDCADAVPVGSLVK